MTILPCTPARAKWTFQPCSVHTTAWHWIWGGQDCGKDSTIGCIWVEPQVPTKEAHQSSVCGQAPFTSVLPSSGAKILVQGKGKTHVKRIEPAGAQPSGHLLQQLGIRAHPCQDGDSHWAERKFCLTPRASSNLYISNPMNPKNLQYAAYKKLTPGWKTHTDWKWGGGKGYFMQMEMTRKWG